MTFLKSPFIVLTFIMGFGVCVSGESSAQSTQSRPAMSPWLMMNSQSRGGTGSNFLDFVKPRQEIYQAYENQQRQIQQQAAVQRNMQQAMQQGIPGGGQGTLNDGSANSILSAPNRVKSIGGMQGAGYRQYMHYYQGGMRQGGVPNFATGRRY